MASAHAPVGRGTAKAAMAFAARQPRPTQRGGDPDGAVHDSTAHNADSDSDASSGISEEELGERPEDQGMLHGMTPAPTAIEGDEITFGAGLPPDTRAEVEAARDAHPKWASHRSLTAASDEEIERMP